MIGGICAEVIRERERTGRLQLEVARLEKIRADCSRLSRENGRWREALAGAGDINALRHEYSDIGRLRSAIDSLDLEQQTLKRALGLRVDAVWPAGAEVRPAGEWRFRGQASPGEALESVLWSARSGDVDHLTSLITLEPHALQRAEEIFSNLPDAAKAQYGSPETIVATLVASQMPTDYLAMAAVHQTEPSPDSALLTVRLEDGTGAQRDLTLKFQQNKDSWSLDVPEPVVSSFAAQLDGSEPMPTALK